MTVSELIQALECYDGNLEVVTKLNDTNRVSGIENVKKRRLGAWCGEDRNVVVVFADYIEGIV